MGTCVIWSIHGTRVIGVLEKVTQVSVYSDNVDTDSDTHVHVCIGKGILYMRPCVYWSLHTCACVCGFMYSRPMAQVPMYSDAGNANAAVSLVYRQMARVDTHVQCMYWHVQCMYWQMCRYTDGTGPHILRCRRHKCSCIIGLLADGSLFRTKGVRNVGGKKWGMVWEENEGEGSVALHPRWLWWWSYRSF